MPVKLQSISPAQQGRSCVYHVCKRTVAHQQRPCGFARHQPPGWSVLSTARCFRLDGAASGTEDRGESKQGDRPSQGWCAWCILARAAVQEGIQAHKGQSRNRDGWGSRKMVVEGTSAHAAGWTQKLIAQEACRTRSVRRPDRLIQAPAAFPRLPLLAGDTGIAWLLLVRLTLAAVPPVAPLGSCSATGDAAAGGCANGLAAGAAVSTGDEARGPGLLPGAS